MDKIFDKETIELLHEFGVSKQEIKRISKDKLKKESIDILRQIAKAIEAEDFNMISSLTFYSPAGDDMGLDSTCIKFGGIAGRKLDIKELFREIKDLNQPENI